MGAAMHLMVLLSVATTSGAQPYPSCDVRLVVGRPQAHLCQFISPLSAGPPSCLQLTKGSFCPGWVFWFWGSRDLALW